MPLGPGTRLGPYEIHSAIGAGGMGEVYRARDTELQRFVALKVLSERFAHDAAWLTRFEREAHLASSLNHPNIVTIYGVGHTDPSTSSGQAPAPYIAMEFVDGLTLAGLLAEGPLRLERISTIAAQIAAGLAVAHSAGVVHRDLKPQNVMVRPNGLVKIVDFGLGMLMPVIVDDASSLSTAAPLTSAGVILGTVQYMSPEQARAGSVDFRSDQFSLGSIIYEMVTGRRAFSRPTAIQTLAAIIEDRPDPMTVVAPAVPPALESIVERCLSKDPADRFASTDDLARELRQLQSSAAASAWSPMGAPAATSQSRRYAGWSAAALALAVIAGVGIPAIRHRLVTGAAVPGAATQQLAILPFVNVGGDAVNQPFSDGLVEVLTSQLTEIAPAGTLDVVPASEVRREGVASAREARRSFGVSRVITGSVLRLPTRLRVTVNLVDATTLRQLNARSIDIQQQDIAAMQDGVVREVANLLGARMDEGARQALVAGSTKVPSAYDAYVEGRGYLQRYEALDNVEKAIAAFQRAVVDDPRFALAYAGLGEADWRKYEQTKDPSLVDQARNNCARAIELAGKLPPVFVTLAMIDRGTGRFTEAVEALQRVLAIDPVNAAAYQQLGSAYEALGKQADAETTFKKAVEIRPNYWAGHNDLGAFYYRRGRLEDAAAQFRRVTELTPDNARGYSSLGAMYFLLKRDDDARAMLDKSIAIKPMASAYTNLGNVDFYQQRYAEAAAEFERATQLNQQDSFLWHNLAAAYEWSNQREKARAAFQRTAALAEAQLKVNPKQASVLMDLADCYSMLGQQDRARTLVQQGLRLAPDDVPIMFNAGVVYEQLGDREHALELIGKAIAGGYSRDLVDKAPSLARLRADPRFQKTSRQ